MQLIMECHELGDQWECDARREPITLVEDWEKWFEEVHPTYPFEVYEFINDVIGFTCVKEYDTPMEEGMVFAYYGEDDEPIIIEKFPNATRHTKVPKNILARAKRGEDYDNSLRNCGHISWLENEILYCYTEYADSRISSPF